MLVYILVIVNVYFKLPGVVLNWSQIISLYGTYLEEYLLRMSSRF